MYDDGKIEFLFAGNETGHLAWKKIAPLIKVNKDSMPVYTVHKTLSLLKGDCFLGRLREVV